MERLRDLGDALNHLTTSQKVALGVAVPAAMVTGYLLVKRSQGQRLEDEFEQEEAAKSMATSRQTTIEVKVPRRVVGAVIGRQGANIKQVQEVSGARVNFRDEAGLDESEDRVVLIRGAPEKAQEAERLIHKIIANQPVILTEEIHLPQRALGRIIGSNGDTIRQLCRTSHAKIKIDRGGDERSPDCVKRAAITGTKEQIEHARGLLEEKIAEEEAFRQRLAVSTGNRQQRRGAERPRTRDRQADTRQPRTHQQEAKKLSPTSPPNSPLPQHNDFFEVFVSAVETPGHFWVQMVNAKAPQLDRLVQDMSDYYSEEHVKELEPIHTLMVGDIVAAPFQHDDAWYRARVMGFWKAGTLDLYYVDYGDSGVVKRENLRALRHDFLSLPFQAVECSLAGVAPKGDDWSEQATDLFEELTYCAKWKILMAKTVTYIQHDLQLVPCLLLVDTHGQKDVYIARELVKQGYAVRVKDSDQDSSQSASSTPSEPDPNHVYPTESPVHEKPGTEHSDIAAQSVVQHEEPSKSTLTLSLTPKKTAPTAAEHSDLHVNIKLQEGLPLSPPGGRNVSKISIATAQGDAKVQDSGQDTSRLLEEKLETLERHREKFLSKGGKESQGDQSEDSSQDCIDLLTPISEKSNESKEEESKEQIREPADLSQDSALLTAGASGSERNIRVSVDSDSSMSAADMKALRSELASQLVEASVVRNGVLHPSVESEPTDDVGNGAAEKEADAVTPDFISSTYTSETSVFTTASGVSDLSSPSSDLDDTKHGATAPEPSYLLAQPDVTSRKDSCASSPYISDEDMYTEGSSEEEASTKSRSGGTGVRPKVGSAEVSRHLGSAKEDPVTIPTVEVTAPVTFDLTSSSDGDVYLDAEGQDYSTLVDGEVAGAEGPLQLVDPDTLAEKVIPGKYEEDHTKETTGE